MGTAKERGAMILVLVRDLMFSSKITSAAREIGAAVKIVRDPSQLTARPGESGETGEADRLIVDLNQPAALDAAIAWKRATAGRVIGIVSHVDTETIARAEQSGVDQVLSRGRFVQMLPSLLQNA